MKDIEVLRNVEIREDCGDIMRTVVTALERMLNSRLRRRKYS